MNRMPVLLTATLAFLGAASGAHAETIQIINARIETVGPLGTLPNGSLVIENGRIVAVGASLPARANARVIDAKGQVVTPGFIAPSTNLMTDEIDLVAETRDDASGDKISAGFDVQYGVNPASATVPVARLTGVTRAAITPLVGKLGFGAEDDDAHALQGAGGGDVSHDPFLFAGQAALVRLDANNNNPVFKAKAAVALDLGEAGADHAGGSRGATLVLVKSALHDARYFAKNRAAYDRGDTRALGLSRLDLEALVPVVERKTPLLVRVSRAADIRQALKLAQDENIRVVLEDAEEAWMVADEIAKAGVPVLINPLADLPAKFESLASRLDNAARLQQAGVTFAINGNREFNDLRPLRINAGTAVAYGLPYSAALASITMNPAKIWGINDRVGSLEVGKDADVVIWNSDPLETSSYPTAIFIAGVEQPLRSRRMELRDRYLKPQADYPRAYE
jgi:imidazolonepropionase-like amidohydrolase